MGSFGGRSASCGGGALGLERATRRSEARGSRPKLHGPRARSAGKGPGKGRGGVRHSRSSESRARCARSAHHGSGARRQRRHGGAGGAGGPGSEGWRSPGAGAATCPLSLCALVRPQPWQQFPGAPAGSTQCAPTPRAAAPTRCILPLQVWRRPPNSTAPLLPGEPSPGGPARAGRRQAGPHGTCDPRGSKGLDVSPPGGELSPGTFSPAAGACVCEAVAPPARCSRLPFPPLSPASHPPPQHVYSSPRAHSPVRSSLPPVRLNY